MKSQQFKKKIIFQKKFKKNSSLTEQKTVDRSVLILKRNTKFSHQKSNKPRSMLPVQEGIGEMSLKSGRP